MSEASPPRGAVVVDGSFVPVPAPRVGTVNVDDEAVLVDESSDVLVPLNPMAALVWACFDGTSSLGEICADLAEGLGFPFETVLRDVVDVTRRLVGAEGISDLAVERQVGAVEDIHLRPSTAEAHGRHCRRCP